MVGGDGFMFRMYIFRYAFMKLFDFGTFCPAHSAASNAMHNERPYSKRHAMLSTLRSQSS